MTEAFTEIHLERLTDTLQMPETKKQIETMFDASYLIEKGQYGQGGKLLLGILKSQADKQSGNYSSLILELKFNMMLTDLYSARQYPASKEKLMQNFVFGCEHLLQQIQKHEEVFIEQQDEEQWPFANHLRVRIYTSLLQFSIKSGLESQPQWLDELIELLSGKGQKYLPQVMGKLCGCKDLNNFCLNFNYDQILLNQQYLPPSQRKSPAQKAKIIDIASTWFIIGAQLQKGIQLKQKAILLWKQANSLKQHEKCEIQYMELKSNANSQFCTRLKRLAKINAKIQKTTMESQKKTKKQQKQISVIVKKGLAKTIKSIDSFNDQLDRMQDEISKANKKKSLWSSSKKTTTISTKKSVLNDSKLLEYYSKAHQFRTQCYAKQKHEEITSLLDESSKFILEQKKMISKAIVPIVKTYTMRRKWAFLTLKNWYIVKFGIPNKDFLNSLPLIKMTQKKNSEQKNLTQSSKKIEDLLVEPLSFEFMSTFAGTSKFANHKKND